MSSISLLYIKEQIESNIKESERKNTMFNPFRDKGFSLKHIKIRQQLLSELKELSFNNKQSVTEDEKNTILTLFDKAIDASDSLLKANNNKGQDQHSLLVEQRNRIEKSKEILINPIQENLPIQDTTSVTTRRYGACEGNRFIGNKML